MPTEPAIPRLPAFAPSRSISGWRRGEALHVRLALSKLLKSIRRLARREKPALGYARHGPTAALLVAYLLVSSAASVWLSPPEAVKAILALPALVIVPLLVGSALLRLIPIDRDVPGLDGFGRALIEWLVGSLALTALAVVLQLSGQTFLLQRFGLVALALAVASFFVGRLGIPRLAPLPLGGVPVVALGAAALFSMAPKMISAQVTPFPLVAQDLLSPLYFSQPALRMLEHGYLTLNATDSPAHGPGLLILIAVLSQLYNAEPISILWMGPFLLFAVFSTGLLLWAHAVSRQWSTALLVTIVGLFILTGDLPSHLTLLSLRSNSVLFALFPLGLYVMHRLSTEGSASRRAKIESLIALQASVGVLFVAMNAYRLGLFTQDLGIPFTLGAALVIGLLLATANRRRWHWNAIPLLLVIVVAFQTFHVFLGPVLLTALIVYGLATTLRGSQIEGRVTAGLSVAAVGFFLLQFSGVLSFPQGFSLVSPLVFGSMYEGYGPPFAARADALQTALSPLLIVLLLFGAAGSLTGRGGPAGRAVLMAAAVSFLVYLLPDVFAFRTGIAMVPFLAFLIVAGANNLGRLGRQAMRWVGSDRPLIQEVVQLGLVAAALPAILAPFLDHNTLIRPYETYHSDVADVEYALIDWFEENTDENVRIISDPDTTVVLSTFANKVSPVETVLLVREMSPAGREQLRFIQDAVLTAPNGCAAYAAIRSLAGSEPASERRYLEAIGAAEEEPRYFVVWTAKTYFWSKREDGIDPMRTPQGGDMVLGMVGPFDDSQFVRRVAKIGEQAYVYEVLPLATVVESGSGFTSSVLGVAEPPAFGCSPTP
ncbi:MAG: hypothetical protein IIB21_00565 [Chloroflexi bacterium]|nr:hypothetical protein [Chloroflexota bacterium]